MEGFIKRTVAPAFFLKGKNNKTSCMPTLLTVAPAFFLKGKNNPERPLTAP